MADWNDNHLQEPEPYITSSKVDKENCMICSKEIQEGEKVIEYGSAINRRFYHTKCRLQELSVIQ